MTRATLLRTAFATLLGLLAALTAFLGARTLRAPAPVAPTDPAPRAPAAAPLTFGFGGEDFDWSDLDTLPTEPSSRLGPVEVVQAQLRALQHPDLPEPGAGFAITFGFASPGNRSSTGPLPRFTAMLQRPPYDTMVRSTRFLAKHLRSTDTGEVVIAAVTHPTAGEAQFLFQLSRQPAPSGELCWLTDNVSPTR